MNDPTITTIIPTYNRSEFLKRAIESVLSQTFKDFVIYVYDNASEDATPEIVAEYAQQDARVFYFRNSRNIGAVNNIVQGIQSVKTPFFSILGDDDFLLPTFYENAISAFERYQNAEFVCAKTVTIKCLEEQMEFRNRDWAPGVYEPSKDMATKMYHSHFVSTGVLFKKSIGNLIGEFEASGNDVLYLTMAAASAPFIVLNGYGAAFLMHRESYSAKGGMSKERKTTLCENLLNTIATVNNLVLPVETKGHLLLLTAETYSAAMNSTKSKLGLYEKVVRKILFYIEKLRQEKKGKLVINWNELPMDAKSFLLNTRRDISGFISYLKRNAALLEPNNNE